MDDEAIVAALEQGLVVAIARTYERARPPVVAVELDIYPWHGYVALSVLDATTDADLLEHPADWMLFEVASSMDAGTGAEVIGEWSGVAEAMNERLRLAAPGGRPSATAHCHRLTARALTSEVVATALRQVGWSDAQLRVVDVDDPGAFNYAGPNA